jgi:hypothetical protein
VNPGPSGNDVGVGKVGAATNCCVGRYWATQGYERRVRTYRAARAMGEENEKKYR